MVSPVSGGEWAWLTLPATALCGALVKALGWLLRAERERGRAESYREHAMQTLAAKEAEIVALRAEVAALRAASGQD